MTNADVELDNQDLRIALNLVKKYITPDHTMQNVDLHRAVTLIVQVARNNGLLLQTSTEKNV